MLSTYAPLATTPALSRQPGPVARMFSWLAACSAHNRQRNALSLLTDEELRDVGLTRADVARECGRWPWDGPMLNGLRPAPLQPYRPLVRSMS